MSEIVPIIMPKWGLSMAEGTVSNWWKREGEAFAEGEEIVDVETSKIANSYEAPFSGRLAKIVAQEGDVVPVGGLIGVSADETVTAAEIDAFVEEFQANFVPEIEDESEGGGFRIETATVDGRDYRFGTLGNLGSGTAIVLIHGFSGDLNNWLFNLDAVQSEGAVLALELPGHGASSKDVGKGTLSELSEPMAGLLQAKGVSSAILVGHSLGAAVAMQLALDHPGLAKALVLLAPAGLPGSVVNPDFLEGLVDAQSARQLMPSLKLLFADEGLATRDMAEEMMKFKRLDGADEALGAIARQLRDAGQFEAIAGRLTDLPPTTVVLGTIDKVVSAPQFSALPQAWSVHQLASGHMPHMELAGEVNALLVAAIREGSGT